MRRKQSRLRTLVPRKLVIGGGVVRVLKEPVTAGLLVRVGALRRSERDESSEQEETPHKR